MSPRWCERCKAYREPVHDHPPTLFDKPEPRKLARSEDPPTSIAAAHRLRRAQTMRRNLLTAFLHGNHTAEEAATWAGYEPADGAWKRVSDLLTLGLIEPTGETRTSHAGRQQRVLRITAKGREAA